MNPFINKLKCIWDVIRSRNVIVIHSIKEFTDEYGDKGRIVAVRRRTDYDCESDYLSMVAGVYRSFPEKLNKKKNEIHS